MRTTSLRPQASARVDGVARRARDVGDDRPLLAEQRVEQARLADVRAADERDRGRLAVRLGGHRRVPAGGLGIVAVEIGVVVGVLAVGVVVRLRVADDERLEAAGGDLVGPRLGLGLARLARDLRLALGRQRPDDGVEQVAGAAAVRRGDRVGLLPAERVELGALELALLVVGLVDGDDAPAPWPGAGCAAASRSAGVSAGRRRRPRTR